MQIAHVEVGKNLQCLEKSYLAEQLIPLLKMPFCKGVTPQLTSTIIVEALTTAHCLGKMLEKIQGINRESSTHRNLAAFERYKSKKSIGYCNSNDFSASEPPVRAN